MVCGEGRHQAYNRDQKGYDLVVTLKIMLVLSASCHFLSSQSAPLGMKRGNEMPRICIYPPCMITILLLQPQESISLAMMAVFALWTC